jgi:hypothetical protein
MDGRKLPLVNVCAPIGAINDHRYRFGDNHTHRAGALWIVWIILPLIGALNSRTLRDHKQARRLPGRPQVFGG